MYGMYRGGLGKILVLGGLFYGVVWVAGHYLSRTDSFAYVFGGLAVGAVVVAALVYRLWVR